MSGLKNHNQRKSEAGMSLLELVLSMSILATGMAGILLLFTTAINGNNRAKLDTGATLVAQMTIEQLAAVPANKSQNITIQDCNPGGAQSWTLSTTAGGATMNTATGVVNWTAQAYTAVPANYKMRYVSCGTKDLKVTYEVRTFIQTITASTKLIVVSARPLGGVSNSLRMFALPVTLRTISGI